MEIYLYKVQLIPRFVFVFLYCIRRYTSLSPRIQASMETEKWLTAFEWKFKFPAKTTTYSVATVDSQGSRRCLVSHLPLNFRNFFFYHLLPLVVRPFPLKNGLFIAISQILNTMQIQFHGSRDCVCEI